MAFQYEAVTVLHDEEETHINNTRAGLLRGWKDHVCLPDKSRMLPCALGLYLFFISEYVFFLAERV